MNRTISRVRSWLLGTAAGLLGLAALAPAPAHAVVGTIDPVPAASLLVPYFEVDLNREDGAQTSIRLTNSTATAILAHVTLWSDMGVPTLNFNVYQQGYVTTEIDLRMVFKGILPNTASAGQDPTDLISPHGSSSQDINFASCSGILPYARLPAATITGLRNAHTGVASTLTANMCAGSAKGDNIARGFVTIETVNNCTARFPTDVGYFINGGNGDATSQNVMTGSVIYTNKAASLASTEPLVALEASPTNPLTDGTGDYTFYGGMLGFTGVDNREPVFAVSDARYFNSSVGGLRTDLIVWRDPGTKVQPFTCGTTPAPFPLGQRQIMVFDDQENPTSINTSPFGIVAQRVPVSSLTSNVGGHILLNLTRTTNAMDPGNNRYQSYISVQHNQPGTYGGGAPALQYTNASGPSNLNFTIGN
jgi:hypothetical protein